MTEHNSSMEKMVHLAEEMAEVAVAGQTVGLRILAAEMQALTHLMPGLVQGAHDTSTDAEIEAEFDNMPV